MSFPFQHSVTTSLSLPQVYRRLLKIPDASTGRAGVGLYAKAILIRVGLTALSHIWEAFIAKADGGADEAGERWDKLKPETVAYGRRHKDVRRKNAWIKYPGSKRAPFAPSWMLRERERKRWWALYSHYLAAFHGDKGHAAALAWIILKNEGAQTLLGTYGQSPHQILRDTGLLGNSLQNGVIPGPIGYPPTTAHPPEHQIFETVTGTAVIGTNRKHAGTHHKGIPGRIPQRRLWPDPVKWPSRWWRDILEQLCFGVIDVTVYLLRK